MTLLPTPFLFSLLLATQAMATDDGYQNLASISRTASQYAAELHSGRAQPPQITAGELDPRLRLANCTTKLQAFLPAGARAQGNTTVGVRCNGRSPWQVYVPVAVKILDQVLVASRPLARGTPLTR